LNKKAVLLLLLIAFFFVRPAFAILGDVNQDGKVDVIDIAMVSKAYGSTPSSPRWNPAADLNEDLRVDVTDLAIVSAHFGQHE
jgi:hypothetical protein